MPLARSEALTRGLPSCGRIVMGLRVVVASEPVGDERARGSTGDEEEEEGPRGGLVGARSDWRRVRGEAGGRFSDGLVRRGEELGVDDTELSGEL